MYTIQLILIVKKNRKPNYPGIFENDFQIYLDNDQKKLHKKT